MIVLDASAGLEYLLGTAHAGIIEDRLSRSNWEIYVPHLFDLEIAQILRRLIRTRQASSERCQQVLSDLADLSLIRYAHVVLLPRVWELRNNLTAYDAAYVALAEALDAPLITKDWRLAAAPGHRAKIEAIPPPM